VQTATVHTIQVDTSKHLSDTKTISIDLTCFRNRFVINNIETKTEMIAELILKLNRFVKNYIKTKMICITKMSLKCNLSPFAIHANFQSEMLILIISIEI